MRFANVWGRIPEPVPEPPSACKCYTKLLKKGGSRTNSGLLPGKFANLTFFGLVCRNCSRFLPYFPPIWESAKVSHKRVFALLTPEIHSYEMAQMLQKPVFALPGCQRMSVNTLLCDTLALADHFPLSSAIASPESLWEHLEGPLPLDYKASLPANTGVLGLVVVSLRPAVRRIFTELWCQHGITKHPALHTYPPPPRKHYENNSPRIFLCNFGG